MYNFTLNEEKNEIKAFMGNNPVSRMNVRVEDGTAHLDMIDFADELKEDIKRGKMFDFIFGLERDVKEYLNSIGISVNRVMIGQLNDVDELDKTLSDLNQELVAYEASTKISHMR